jgi:hypothetical protein
MGRTPLLIYAITAKKIDFTQLIGLDKANPNKPDKNSDTLLHHLVKNKELEAALQALTSIKFEKPIDVNIQNDKDLRAFDLLLDVSISCLDEHEFHVMNLVKAFIDKGVIITRDNMQNMLRLSFPLPYIKILLYHPNFKPGEEKDIITLAKNAMGYHHEAIPLILARFPKLRCITTLFDLAKHGFNKWQHGSVRLVLNYIPKDVMLDKSLTPIPFHRFILEVEDSHRAILFTRYLDNYPDYAQQPRQLKGAMSIMSLMNYRNAKYLDLRPNWREVNASGGRFFNILSKIHALELKLFIVVELWAGLELKDATTTRLQFATYHVLLDLLLE